MYTAKFWSVHYNLPYINTTGLFTKAGLFCSTSRKLIWCEQLHMDVWLKPQVQQMHSLQTELLLTGNILC